MQPRWALNQLGALAFAGLVAGGIAAWIGVASQDGAAAVAATAVEWRMLLFVMLAVAAIVRGWLDGVGEDAAVYDDAPKAIGASVALGAVGGAIGVALWLVAVMQVSTVFGGEKGAEVIRVARNLLGWDGAGLAVAIAAAGGLIGAVVARRRHAG